MYNRLISVLCINIYLCGKIKFFFFFLPFHITHTDHQKVCFHDQLSPCPLQVNIFSPSPLWIRWTTQITEVQLNFISLQVSTMKIIFSPSFCWYFKYWLLMRTIILYTLGKKMKFELVKKESDLRAGGPIVREGHESLDSTTSTVSNHHNFFYLWNVHWDCHTLLILRTIT